MDIGGKTFGELLTFLRDQKDVTLRELARGIGVSAPFLSDVEKGRRSALTAERIEKVAAVLHLDTDEKTESPQICLIISWNMSMLVRHFAQLVTLMQARRSGSDSLMI